MIGQLIWCVAHTLWVGSSFMVRGGGRAAGGRERVGGKAEGAPRAMEGSFDWCQSSARPPALLTYAALPALRP